MRHRGTNLVDRLRRGSPWLLAVLTLAALPVSAQISSAANSSFRLPAVTGFTRLPNGVDLQAGPARMQIVALRDDVLRIRVSRTKILPEDASWAVLANPRSSSIAVTPAETGAALGFATKDLRVAVDRATLALTVSDTAGNVIVQDAEPITWTGDAFRITKSMPLDEHFFGLDRNKPYTSYYGPAS